MKVEAAVTHRVSIEGFRAQEEHRTHFELEKMPVADNIWLPRHFAMRSQAKILFFLTLNAQAGRDLLRLLTLQIHAAATDKRALVVNF